jgi:hypothetical protein
MLMFITTTSKWVARKEYPNNGFVEQNKSTDLTHAKVSARIRGLFDLPDKAVGGIQKPSRPGEVIMGLHGTQLVVWIQAEVRGVFVNFALTGQPFRVTHDWSEQSVTLTPDPSQWTCARSRHDLTRKYGCADISDVLKDVNVDMYFALFPLTIVPIGDVKLPHQTRAGEAYPVDQQFLPKGILMFDWVKIEYPR